MEKVLDFFIKWNVVALVPAITAILIYITVILIKKIIPESSKIKTIFIALICVAVILLAAGAVFAVITYKINTDHRILLLIFTFILQTIPWYCLKKYFWG